MTKLLFCGGCCGLLAMVALATVRETAGWMLQHRLPPALDHTHQRFGIVTRLYDSNTPPEPSRSKRETRSFVEGDVFEDPVEEIEALGGDPFFLENETDEDDAPPPEDDFLWDGVEDDNAHLDLD